MTTARPLIVLTLLIALVFTGESSYAAVQAKAVTAPIGAAGMLPPPDVKTAETSGFVTRIDIKGKEGQIQLNGTDTEGVVLNVSPDTVLVSADGKPMKWDELHLGADVTAIHSLAMTLSLPPQTSVYELKVNEQSKEELLGTAGVIADTSTGTDKVHAILIRGEGLSEASPAEVWLQLKNVTTLMTQDGEPVTVNKLVKGSRVIGFYSPHMTKSAPPTAVAWKVVLMPEPQ